MASAFPFALGGKDQNGADDWVEEGLSKREYFFIKILNGLLSGRLNPEWSSKEFIQTAIEMTDESFERLQNKQK
jgi:hypothetical protein